MPGKLCIQAGLKTCDAQGSDFMCSQQLPHLSPLSARVQSLTSLCGRLGLGFKSELYSQDLNRKRAELLETSVKDVSRAEAKLASLQQRAAELGEELGAAWAAAAAGGVPMSAMAGVRLCVLGVLGVLCINGWASC
jgi:hypothetical protein